MPPMPNEPRAAVQRSVRLEVEATCAACRRPVGLGAPHLRLACSACGETVELGAAHWARLFAEIDEKSFDLAPADRDTRVAEESTPDGKLVARYTLGAPECSGCRAEIRLVDPGADDMLACSSCSTRTATFQVPGWLRTELPTAMQLYAASREVEPRAGSFWLTFQGTPPARKERHDHQIQAAIGPVPESPVSVPVPVKKSAQRTRWEWVTIIGIVVVIVVAVRQCGRRAAGTSAGDRDNAVESAQ
jgi:hypothetical protein